MKGSKFLQDFKAFALKGNVMDLAVGVIIGGAFGKIVSSLVADVIMPLLGLLVGGINFTDLHFTLKAAKEVDGVLEPAVLLNYGKFLQSAFDFLIIAFSIFLFIRLLSRLKTKETRKRPPLRHRHRPRLRKKSSCSTRYAICCPNRLRNPNE